MALISFYSDCLPHLAQVIALLKVLRFDSVSHLLIGHSERLDCFFKVLTKLKMENKAQLVRHKMEEMQFILYS